MAINNAHDNFFKMVFGDKDKARRFLNWKLPDYIKEVVDLNKIEPVKDSFVNIRLNEHYADMLYRTDISGKPGYLYFLFEIRRPQSH